MVKEYNFSKTGGQCTACQKDLKAGDEIVATLRETREDFCREDLCPACWQGREHQADSELVGFWHSRVPRTQAKKKTFVDDDLLMNFFQRLSATEEPAKVNFRFVLALVLMRKKLLVYDRFQKLPDGREVWEMHFKGDKDIHKVIDPRMDEAKIAEVSQHLDEILPTSQEES